MFSPFFDIDRFEDYKDYYLKESQEALILELDVPGFSEEDLQIYIEGKSLHINGNRTGNRNVKMERSFSLSNHIDTEKVEAEIKNGLLTIKLPKAEKKKIEVKCTTLHRVVQGD
jgi:HSP20 family protein